MSRSATSTAARTRWPAYLATIATTWLVVAIAAAPAAACTVCYGARDSGSALVGAARLGIFLLLGVTVSVLGGFARFFFHLRQRARRAELDAVASDWAQLQRSASR